MADEQRIADLLMAAIGEIRTDPGAAVEKLTEVCDALAGHASLDDVRARALSLLAQGRLATDDPSGAETAAMEAMRIARRLGDEEGLAEVRALHETIAAERDRHRRERAARKQAADLAATSLDDLVARASSPLALADVLIKHVGALRLHDAPERAEASARRAILAADEAGTVRERVLARLALAEVRPDAADASLAAALQIADDASETTLIGLVAKAAELAGATLPAQHGPDLARPAPHERTNA